MRIREAVEDDLPAILDIFNEVIAHSTAVYRLEPVPLAERQAWFEERRALGYPVLVAEEEQNSSVLVAKEEAGQKRVLGFSSFGDWRGYAGYRFTIEHSVHIHQDYRGKGVGKNLVEALFPYANALDKHVMLGAIDAENTGSIRFHEKLGFVKIAHFPEVGFKFGRWLDVVFMQYRLDAPGATRPD